MHSTKQTNATLTTSVTPIKSDAAITEPETALHRKARERNLRLLDSKVEIAIDDEDFIIVETLQGMRDEISCVQIRAAGGRLYLQLNLGKVDAFELMSALQAGDGEIRLSQGGRLFVRTTQGMLELVSHRNTQIASLALFDATDVDELIAALGSCFASDGDSTPHHQLTSEEN